MSNRSGARQLTPTIVLHTLQGTRPGPTALVQAGIHGDEIAGVHALEELLESGFLPDAGRVLIIPVMNPAAYRARQRIAPGGLDLNRCFPGDAGAPEPERRMARLFMDLIEQEKPELVLTLHESMKRFHPDMPVSFGQTLVYGVKPMPPIVGKVIQRMNEQLENPYERWDPHFYPVATSSTEVIVEKMGCIGVCVETWQGFELPRRVAMQRQVVRTFLSEMGLLAAAT
jgi:predicted deacylase